jgi:uncharacterized membrane protein
MMPAMSADPVVPPELSRLRAASVASLLALIALGLAWELWLARTGTGSWALKVLPLTLALPGLLKQRLYTYRWLSLLVWLYVAEGALRATTEGGVVRVLALLQAALALLLFTLAVMHVRARLGPRGGAR